MPKKNQTDRTSATYLDQLGTESAKIYAPGIKRQALERGLPLPLPDADVEYLLGETIRGLQSQKKLNWLTFSLDRQAVFTNAWTAEMDRQGIRA